jgi:hypothetical protein
LVLAGTHFALGRTQGEFGGGESEIGVL